MGVRELFSGIALCRTYEIPNLGVSDKDGKISPTDDLHLLPFDGIMDWKYTSERLKKSRLPEVMNFELNIQSKPGRHENDAYEKMTYEKYFTEEYKRAESIRNMRV